MENYYTIKEAADILKLAVVTIRKHIRSGDLKANKAGGSWRITESDLKDFLKPNNVKEAE